MPDRPLTADKNGNYPITQGYVDRIEQEGQRFTVKQAARAVCDTFEDMCRDVMENGGEYAYTTIKGQIQPESMHRIEPPCQT